MEKRGQLRCGTRNAERRVAVPAAHSASRKEPPLIDRVALRLLSVSYSRLPSVRNRALTEIEERPEGFAAFCLGAIIEDERDNTWLCNSSISWQCSRSVRTIEAKEGEATAGAYLSLRGWTPGDSQEHSLVLRRIIFPELSCGLEDLIDEGRWIN